jgi:hypothetical protein
MKCPLVMAKFIILLTAILFTACNSGSPGGDGSTTENKTPLRCVKCKFIEYKGEWRISGEIQNVTKEHFESVVMDVELKDAKGDVVARQDNMPLPGGSSIKSRSSREFSQAVTSKQTAITQATVLFKNVSTNERLSLPVTLLRIVSLENN